MRDAGRSFELGGKKVGIIGVGGIGRILARLCEALGMQTLGFQTGDYPTAQKKEEVESAGCIYYDDMEKLLADSDFVSVHVPLNPSTRGLIGKEDGTLVSYPEYWQEALSRQGIERSICAIGGPCTSYELVWHDQTEVAFCGTDAEALRMMKETMQTGYYHISLTRDVIGLESAVALKNAYALGVALTIGLVNRQGGPDAGLHFNSQAGAFYQAVREMTRLVRLQGGSEESLAIGIGDLYVTIYGGRTRRIGILLGEGKTYEEAMEILSGVTLESLVVAGRVARAIRKKAEAGTLSLSDFPLLVHADRVVTEGADASLPWEAFTFETL